MENNFELALVEKRNEKLVKYLRHTLTVLPSAVISLDTSKWFNLDLRRLFIKNLVIIYFKRVLLAYFAVAGLDVMNKLDKLPHSKQDLIDWIYNHQIADILNSIKFKKLLYLSFYLNNKLF